MHRVISFKALLRLLRPDFSLFMVLLFTVSGGAAGYFWGQHTAQNRALVDLSLQAESHHQQLTSLFSRYEFMPDLAQMCPCVKGVLADPEQPDRVAKANRWLETVAGRINAEAVYIMDPAGNTLAASNWNTKGSFVGKNYAIRPYFQEAMKGRLGRYVALGITSRKLGYYLAKPVINDEGGVGAIVVKVGLDLSRQWLQNEAKRTGVDAVVLDEGDVAFLASDPAWEFRPVRPLSEGEKEQIRKARRYEGSGLESLDLRHLEQLDAQNRLVFMGRQDPVRVVAHRIPLMGTEWTLETYMPLSFYRNEVYGYTAFGAVSGLTLALLLLIVLVREEYRKQLLASAVRDPLTGLYSRLYMNEIIPSLIERHKRDPDKPLTAILFDLDHFKRVNDEHGHLAGDKVLRAVGSAVLGQMRAGDVAVRYGGEELVVFAPDCSLDDARKLAERIRSNVARLRVPANRHRISVTLSAGVASRQPDESQDELLKRVDDKLYQAKKEGRDRVCS
ncbi:MAG: diguanylate cyclase [Sedimenticola sp.]